MPGKSVLDTSKIFKAFYNYGEVVYIDEGKAKDEES